MNDPLLEELRAIRRVRIRRYLELKRRIKAGLPLHDENPEYPKGHDVVDLSSGVRRVVIKGKRSPARNA
jgi:hypothetical protein